MINETLRTEMEEAFGEKDYPKALELSRELDLQILDYILTNLKH